MTRRVVHLLVLLGAAVAAYLALSLFDHAARADAGSVDRIGTVASVKAVAGGVKKAVPEPTSISPKSTAPKAHPRRIHRPTVKTPEVHPPKVHAAKKIHAPSIGAGETVRRVQVRTSTLRQPTSDVVRDAARATMTLARTAVVPSLSEFAELPGLPQATLGSWTQLPDLPQAELLALPKLPSWPQLRGLPQAQFPAWPQPPAFAAASGLSGVTKPPAAQAQPRTAPLPAPPRQPADRSTPTGQARDSGGGNAPATGTVSSSWRPEVAAAGHHLATDLPARGRTVRYAGPPS